MTEPESTVMARYWDIAHQHETARLEVTGLLEDTFRQMFPDGSWIALLDDPDEREVALYAVLDAEGNVIMDLSDVEELPEITAELAAQWRYVDYRGPAKINEWLTELYQHDALDCDLPSEFDVDCYLLDDNRPCLHLLRTVEEPGR